MCFGIWRRPKKDELSRQGKKVAKPIEIKAGHAVSSVVFLGDGKHILSGGERGKICRWRLENGKQEGTSMKAGSAITNMVVSRDGQLMANGTKKGRVILWNPFSHTDLKHFKAHRKCVNAVDISPDGTRMATGSADKKVRVWSMSSWGRVVKGSLKHGSSVIAVKFSPDGQLIATATATGKRSSVRIYNSSGEKLGEVRIQVGFSYNQSLAWTSDSRRLFAVSSDRKVHCLDVSTFKTLASWPIHGTGDSPLCIALANDDTLAVVTSNSFVSVWDTTTRQLVGSVERQSNPIYSMAVSPNFDFLTGGKKKITVRNLRDTLPAPYCDNMPCERKGPPLRVNPTLTQSIASEETLQRIEGIGNVVHDIEKRLSTSVASQDEDGANEAVKSAPKQVESPSKDQKVTTTDTVVRKPPASNQVKVRTSSYEECKKDHAKAHRKRRFGEAFKSFEMMLTLLENSPDPKVQELRSQYIDPTSAIQDVINQTLREMPIVLINAETGRLCDKSQQTAAFKAQPIYNELRSSMTTPNLLDDARIRAEVEKFYQYAMFSHRWQPPQEPTFQMLENGSVDELPKSPQNDKLRGFRDVVRSRKLLWLWSDTCCTNQDDKGVVQESVVAMFRWYRRSALTVVHLLGVLSDSEEADLLRKSIWNTRGWTYQEYVASPVVQFYTEDWKPYRKLAMHNHKESPIIHSEMERATKVSSQELATLEPGLDRVREKLYLASKRETTCGEDIAYCLFGIFSVSTLPVIYGVGKETAVSRLLQHILTHSDNVTILSWTGASGSGNHSYLPADLTVYNQIPPPHIQSVKEKDMPDLVRQLKGTPLVVELYNRLYSLPRLSLDVGRLKLPGLILPLTHFSHVLERNSTSFHYRATAPIIGDISIRTKDDLRLATNLRLVHPWISALLDEDLKGGVPQFDVETCAHRLLVRLRQPFGALLLAPGTGRQDYKRVATDVFIQVEIREETSLKELMDSVGTIDLQ